MSDPSSPTGFIPPAPENLADLFPSYDIVRLIACGGMGAVYQAVQRSLDRGVAIKILPGEFTADESFRTNFQAEAKAMARLNHPNLISVYDFGEIDGMLFIIMEYVSGQSLHQAISDQTVDPQDAARLVISIAHGLAHAHENGIIHRDIKPANILLDNRNEPKIGDFGLARPLESQIQEGEDIFGTPGYTAPEVVGDPQSIDHRADIFSLGILLHELLTGKLPAADPHPASAICQCDPRFDAVIRKATQPAPGSRYADAEGIAKDLQKIITTAGPRALRTAEPQPRHPSSHPPTHYQALPKQTGSKAFLIVIPLIVIGVIGFLYHQKSQQAPTESQAREPARNERPPPGQTTTPHIEPPRPDPGENNDEKTEITTVPTLPTVPTESLDGVEHWRGASSSWQSSGEIHSFTLESGNIQGNHDDGAFKHETWNGDGYFTIRIDSLNGGRPTDAKAGLMLREDINDGARNIFLARTSGGETLIQIRQRENRETMEITRIRASHSHLGIQRTGDMLTAVASTDGQSWTDLGTFQISNLATTLHIGFAAGAASNRGEAPLTGTFHSPTLQAVDESLLADDAPTPRVNIGELFRRARSVMKERAAPIIAEYQSNLDESNDFHQDHLDRQREIEREYARKMDALRDIYLNGIRMQIERSRAEDDAGAVLALTAEKERVIQFPYYFRSLMERND